MSAKYDYIERLLWPVSSVELETVKPASEVHERIAACTAGLREFMTSPSDKPFKGRWRGNVHRLKIRFPQSFDYDAVVLVTVADDKGGARLHLQVVGPWPAHLAFGLFVVSLAGFTCYQLVTQGLSTGKVLLIGALLFFVFVFGHLGKSHKKVEDKAIEIIEALLKDESAVPERETK